MRLPVSDTFPFLARDVQDRQGASSQQKGVNVQQRLREGGSRRALCACIRLWCLPGKTCVTGRTWPCTRV